MSSPLDLSCFVAGEKIQSDERLTIRSPEDVHAGADLDPERRRLMQQAMAPASTRARSLDTFRGLGSLVRASRPTM